MNLLSGGYSNDIGSKCRVGFIAETNAKKVPEFVEGICVVVWIVKVGHFHDPSHGGFLHGAIHYFKASCCSLLLF
ncbi:calcium-transporting ATPase 3, endoplasmic reticulum-type-like [Cajanus cajan]|uniref:calcium-transporting ATPase 3, endoplasmic reticulum-type-like n=1 Tax=Cajanus cajan TaxID=3821 RepID=UPI0010FB8623|nr:calcium-transporting ATPase 3, endoplasmic reticulum-type-like [Cajanus cajan]